MLPSRVLRFHLRMIQFCSHVGLKNKKMNCTWICSPGYTAAPYKTPQEHTHYKKFRNTVLTPLCNLNYFLSADSEFKAIEFFEESEGLKTLREKNSQCSDLDPVTVFCCNSPKTLCPSDSLDSARPVNVYYNINTCLFGPVTLNTFALIITQWAGYAAIITLYHNNLCTGTLLHAIGAWCWSQCEIRCMLK